MTSDTLHLLLHAFTDLIACLVPGPAVLAGTGLSAVVTALPHLFAVLRWVGSGYLLAGHPGVTIEASILAIYAASGRLKA